MSHEDDILELLDKLLELTYQCGKLRTQLEFHIKLKGSPIDEVSPVSVSPQPRITKRRKGDLSRRIVEVMRANPHPLRSIEIARLIQPFYSTPINPESIRTALHRIPDVTKDGTHYILREIK